MESIRQNKEYQKIYIQSVKSFNKFAAAYNTYYLCYPDKSPLNQIKLRTLFEIRFPCRLTVLENLLWQKLVSLKIFNMISLTLVLRWRASILRDRHKFLFNRRSITRIQGQSNKNMNRNPREVVQVKLMSKGYKPKRQLANQCLVTLFCMSMRNILAGCSSTKYQFYYQEKQKVENYCCRDMERTQFQNDLSFLECEP